MYQASNFSKTNQPGVGYHNPAAGPYPRAGIRAGGHGQCR